MWENGEKNKLYNENVSNFLSLISQIRPPESESPDNFKKKAPVLLIQS